MTAILLLHEPRHDPEAGIALPVRFKEEPLALASALSFEYAV
jgi:hypothetical protein